MSEILTPEERNFALIREESYRKWQRQLPVLFGYVDDKLEFIISLESFIAENNETQDAMRQGEVSAKEAFVENYKRRTT